MPDARQQVSDLLTAHQPGSGNPPFHHFIQSQILFYVYCNDYSPGYQ
jgi:hypothetical protein